MFLRSTRFIVTLVCIFSVMCSLQLFAGDDDGLPEIFQVIKAKNPESLRKIISDGENVNQTTGHYGETPLMYAAQLGRREAVEILISANADVKAVSETGNTALHRASHWGHPEICEILIKNGALVNAVKSDGTTPLHDAVMGSPNYKSATRKNLDVCRILIANGADVKAVRADKRTALDMARINSRFQRQEIAEFLQSLENK